jgi:hypothetical protein
MDQLEIGQLDIVRCLSYYQYSSLNTPFDLMVKLIDRRLAENLPALAILHPSAWMDIEILALIWPVDMPGSMKNSDMKHLVSRDMDALSRNSLLEHQPPRKAGKDKTRIDPILHFYLLYVGDSHSLLVREVLSAR